MKRKVCKDCLDALKEGRNTTVHELEPGLVHQGKCDYCGVAGVIYVADVVKKTSDKASDKDGA